MEAREDSRSAYDAAAQDEAVDPRCVPVHLEGPAPEGGAIPYPAYTLADHGTWARLYARQRGRLPDRSCREFLDGLDAMRFPDARIPALRDASRVLESATGWKVARVPGLLHEEEFFAFLARRVFPSTDYIRPPHEMDYTPAPDMFHDVFAHLPMIVHPSFADFYQRMGRAALRAKGADRRRIERFYWFTVEFGLIATPDGIRVYGNGILSSYSEIEHALTDAVTKLPFDPARIVEQEYDVNHLQPLLFVIDSFEQLEAGFDAWARSRGLIGP
jgi:phenylalanine-4-hydroxylase